MATPFTAPNKSAVNSGRRLPLFIGLVIFVVALVGYLG
jgi:hypothetical protein